VSRPLVTIAIPTYNGAAYIAETLSRVLAQTYSSIEVLVVDDASKDETATIVQQFADKDSRIRFVQNEVNLGLVGNWNHCIDLARGEWIKFWFQDDDMVPEAVEYMLQTALSSKQSLVICRRNFRIDDNAIDWLKDYYGNKLPKLEQYFPEDSIVSAKEVGRLVQEVGLFENVFGEPSTYLFHRAITKQYGYFNIDLSQLCDYEFILRVASNQGFIFVAAPLATFRVHGGSESSKNQEQRKLKLQYIDTLLMLHQFLYDPIYHVFRHTLAHSVLQNLYQSIYNGFVEQVGWKRKNELLQPYFARYSNLQTLNYSFVTLLKQLPKRVYYKLKAVK